MMTPERCSSPIPEGLLRQSQQRASSAGHWQNPSDPLQYLQGRSSPHSRSSSPPVTAPLRLSLQHLPGVSGGKLVAARPTRPYTVPVKDQLADSARPSTSYSIDHLLKAGSPHGPKYSTVCRSASSSPCQGVPASPGVAAAAFPPSPAVARLAEQQQARALQPIPGLKAAAAGVAAGSAAAAAAPAVRSSWGPAAGPAVTAATAAGATPALLAAAVGHVAGSAAAAAAAEPAAGASSGPAAGLQSVTAAGDAAGNAAAAAASLGPATGPHPVTAAAAAEPAAGALSRHAAGALFEPAAGTAAAAARCEAGVAAVCEGAAAAGTAAGSAAGHEAAAAAGSAFRPAAAANTAAAGHAAAAPQLAAAAGHAAAATAAAAGHAHAAAGSASEPAAAGHAAATAAAAGHAAAAPEPAVAAAAHAAGAQPQQQPCTANIAGAASPPPPPAAAAPAASSCVAAEPAADIQQHPWVDAWRSRSSVQVFSRNDALQLEAELQSLPPGQLLAAQQQHIQEWANRQHSYMPLQLPGHQQQQQQGDLGLDALSQQVVPWQQQISSIMRQLSQQVALHCVEHGRTLQVLQERYAELANALFLAVSSLTQHHAALLASSQATAAALAASRYNERGLQEQLSSVQTALQESQEANAILTSQHEQLQQDSQQTAQQLQQLVVSLKQQLWQARCDWEQQAAAAEAAAQTEAETASSQVAAAEQEAAGLRQRLGFVEAQMQALKLQLKQVPEVESVSVQTDLEQQTAPVSEPEAETQQVSVEDSGGETESEDSVDEPPDLPKVVDLIDYVSRGSKRSRLWLVKVLGQITADKAVADAVADRQGVGRSNWKDFVPTWGLTRYGLQHLSDQVLGDLCASICSHAAAGVLPARWIACFCSLGPAVKPHKKQQQLWPWQLPGQAAAAAAAAADAQIAFGRRGTPTVDGNGSSRGIGAREAEVLLGSSQAADFWIFCACQLAYPNSVVALFPEAQEALPLVRSNLTMESLKAAFRYLGDPAGQAQFVAERLELAAVQAAEGPGAAAALVADKGSSRPSTSSSASVLGRFGYYNAWALLDLLLAEWLSRAWARAQGMMRLRREVTGLQPPLEEQYGAARAAAEGNAPLLEKLQQAYAVLQPILSLAAAPHAPCCSSNCAAGDAVAASAEQATSRGGSDINTQLEQDAEVLLRDATAADVDAAVQAFKLIASANRQ